MQSRLSQVLYLTAIVIAVIFLVVIAFTIQKTQYVTEYVTQYVLVTLLPGAYIGVLIFVALGNIVQNQFDATSQLLNFRRRLDELERKTNTLISQTAPNEENKDR